MAEITKEEQIQAIYDLKVGYTLGHADIAMLKAMARQLLASMEQEPVIEVTDGDVLSEVFAPGTKLYAAPQLPQPAVASDIGEVRVGRLPTMNQDEYPGLGDWWVQLRIGNDAEEVLARVYGSTPQEANCRAEALASRAAMLQGAEPVQEWIPCSERMPDFDTRVLLYFPDYGGHIEDGCIGDEGDGPYHYFFDGDSLRHEPTNWMQLPAAPQQEVK